MKVIWCSTAFTMILHSLILIHLVCGVCSNTIGQDLDTKLRVIQSNYTILKQQYEHLDREVNEIKNLLRSSCTPCFPKLGAVKEKTRKVCDCTNLEPRRDCLEFYDLDIRFDGLYRLSIGVDKSKSFTVYCDQTTDGGGWTVFQRRMDGVVDFYRNWTEYRDGFGDTFKEHWLGNENIHMLTNSSERSTLLVNMKLNYSKTMTTKWASAKYNIFYVDGKHQHYKLHVSGFSGNVTDELSYNNNAKFTTKDQDHDTLGYANCATAEFYGKNAWWSKACSFVTLNAVYCRMRWKVNSASYVSFSEMKIRRNKRR